MTSLSPSLASIRNELDTTTAHLHALVDTLDDATWRARPSAHRWSVAECIEHLNLTSRAFIPSLRDAVREARDRGLTHPGSAYRVNPVGWLVLRAQEPPVRRGRIRTSKPFVPLQVGPRSEVVRAYERLQQEVIGVLIDADGLALSKVKVPSPFLPRLRYSVYFALRVIPSHQRRHLWQAEQALKDVRSGGR